MKKLSLIVALGLALSGCGEKQAGNDTAAVAEDATPKIENAEDVAKQLKDAGLPITDIKPVTAADDSNQLLGRPGQYTSKLFFYDGRHPKVPESDENENSIEVFASAEDAKTRHDYIENVTKGTPFLMQYLLLSGRVLVRLDKAVLPDEAEKYKAALQEMPTA